MIFIYEDATKIKHITGKTQKMIYFQANNVFQIICIIFMQQNSNSRKFENIINCANRTIFKLQNFKQIIHEPILVGIVMIGNIIIINRTFIKINGRIFIKRIAHNNTIKSCRLSKIIDSTILFDRRITLRSSRNNYFFAKRLETSYSSYAIIVVIGNNRNIIGSSLAGSPSRLRIFKCNAPNYIFVGSVFGQNSGLNTLIRPYSAARHLVGGKGHRRRHNLNVFGLIEPIFRIGFGNNCSDYSGKHCDNEEYSNACNDPLDSIAFLMSLEIVFHKNSFILL